MSNDKEKALLYFEWISRVILTGIITYGANQMSELSKSVSELSKVVAASTAKAVEVDKRIDNLDQRVLYIERQK